MSKYRCADTFYESTVWNA